MQLAWKIYAFVIVLVALVATSTSESKSGLWAVDALLSFIALAALLLFAFRKQVGRLLPWKVLAVVFILLDLAFNLYFSPQELGTLFTTGYWPQVVWGLVIFGPFYYAVAAYGWGKLAPEQKAPSTTALSYTHNVSTPTNKTEAIPMAAVATKPDSFLKQLGKLAAAIIVGWNALMLAMWGPFIALILLLIPFMGAPTEPVDTMGYESVYGNGTNELRSIRINGPIIGDKESDSPFAALDSTSGYDVKQKLADAAGAEGVKGIILEINSPGGTIYGAHAIADGMAYYKKKTGKPVYAYIQGLGASGAYWAAAGADKIIADYGSDIGSIGVIMGPFKYYDTVISESGSLFESGVLTQNGIQHIMITAGKSKDLGNPYRKLTPDELRVLQQQVNNDYDLFVKHVSERRRIPDATIRNVIGAMSYDNKTAEELNLIDSSGSREDAYEALAKAAKVENNYQIMRETSPSSFWYDVLGVFGKKPPKEARGSKCYFAQAHLAYAGDVTSLCSK